MNSQNRLAALRRKLGENKLAALWVSQPDNLFYLSGCEGLEGYLLITEREAIMATDFRYIEQAQRQSPEYRIFRVTGKMADWLPRLLEGQNLAKLGFESGHLSVTNFHQLEQTFKDAQIAIKLVETNGLIETLRTVKDAEEVSKIIEAAKLTDAVIQHVEKTLKPGITERELAVEIEVFLRQHGSQPVPFELIVAAGANSALPHAKPSDHVIQAGEPIVIDIGAKVKNYGSDLTRTLCIGEPDALFKKVYTTVLNAQLAAISGIRSGMTGVEADAIARDVIAKAGYAEAFGHSLGHGIGLVTHEKPTAGPNSTDVLSDGMVFTVEPGIYVSGWGGVRIEDDVVLENGRARLLSHAKK